MARRRTRPSLLTIAIFVVFAVDLIAQLGTGTERVSRRENKSRMKHIMFVSLAVPSHIRPLNQCAAPGHICNACARHDELCASSKWQCLAPVLSYTSWKCMRILRCVPHCSWLTSHGCAACPTE